MSRMQMTEDELVIYFYQFDGNISVAYSFNAAPILLSFEFF